MTPTQQFIEDAIAGGSYQHIIKGREFELWETEIKGQYMCRVKSFWGNSFIIDIHQLLLSPFSWRAVVRKRYTDQEPELGTPDENFVKQTAGAKARLFLTRLFDGKDIESALQSLS